MEQSSQARSASALSPSAPKDVYQNADPALVRIPNDLVTYIERLRPHLLPILVAAMAVAVGQLAVFTQAPIANFTADTGTYLAQAQGISQGFNGLIGSFRTPGYPLFVYAVLALQGSPQYSQLLNCWQPGLGGICTQQLDIVVVAQAILAVIIALECYVLVWRLSHRRWVACLVTSLIGLNIYFGSWERMVLSEFLSFWATLTVFLVFERLVRCPTIWRACLLGFFCFVAIMVRPFNAYLLPLLIVLLAGWYLWTRQFWKQFLHMLSVAAVCAALLLAYFGLNAYFNGFFGLSWETNVTLLGKVIEYHMEYDSVPAQYQDLQSQLQAWVVNPQNTDPWEFSQQNNLNYRATDFQLAGAYARYVIIHHPLTFVRRSASDLLREWINPGQLYSQFGSRADGSAPPTEPDWMGVVGFTSYPELNGYVSSVYAPGWLTTLLSLSTLESYAFLLLPLYLLFALIRVRRRSHRSEQAFVMLAMALAAVGTVCVGAMGNYAEFYRTRFPIDWAVIALAVVWLFDVVASLANVSPMEASDPVLTGEPQWAGQSLLDGVLPRASALDVITAPMSRVRKDAIAHTRDAATAQSSFAQLSTKPGVQSLQPEISVVLPCLNEEDAIGGCIDTLQAIIAAHALSAEIVVVDNASTDRSNEIARAHGARVVYQSVRGYGNAYLKGFAEARGKYIVMADADNTYDLSSVDEFVEPLRHGYDMVIGNRFAGGMAKGAMTFSHRYIGNPILSGILRLFFRTTVRDAHCGMRAFTREAYLRMRLRTGGMEFASEMVINAAKAGLRISERPITYAPRIGESKLHTVRDGWRHLRFMLLYSPTHLFLIPGMILLVLGLGVEMALAPGSVQISRVTFDVHTMLLGSVVALLGVQIIFFGLFARFFSLTEELDGEQDRVLQFLTRVFTLERGLFVGAVIFLLGACADGFVLISWVGSGMGQLQLLRPTVIGSTFLAIGAEIIFGSFFLSYLMFRESLNDPDTPMQHAASVRIAEPSGSAQERALHETEGARVRIGDH